MPAVSTMILAGLRMTGEKERGETLDANEQVECLAEFNSMVESWSLNRLLVYAITEDTYSLTASTSSFSVGPGADFDITRPTRIVDPIFVRDSSGYDYRMTIVTLDMYGSISDKDAGYTYPEYLYYDHNYDSTSTGRMWVYPVPQGGLTLHINSWKQIQTFADLSTTVLLPPGYQLALESNYAIRSAAGYRPISRETAKIAQESLAAIQSHNLPDPVMSMPVGVVMSRGGGNILTGGSR